jgi:hypothetical protein
MSKELDVPSLTKRVGNKSDWHHVNIIKENYNRELKAVWFFDENLGKHGEYIIPEGTDLTLCREANKDEDKPSFSLLEARRQAEGKLDEQKEKLAAHPNPEDSVHITSARAIRYLEGKLLPHMDKLGIKEQVEPAGKPAPKQRGFRRKLTTETSPAAAAKKKAHA